MMAAATARPLLVVCTAGHIDHGKTSLVRALTGVELDTLPEERDRGITIALGFTPMPLGEQGEVSFIDVPGHEGLVRTMIAGAHGVHAAMLVVSALEGVMPQTREHLTILNLLGVERGLIVLTKADLVDDELLEFALADVEELVEGSFLEGAPIVPTSAVTGQGLDALRGHLAELSVQSPDAEGPFRLPIDRSFVRPGFGIVVTGTAQSGRVTEGSTILLQPGGRSVRVRGIEVHGHPQPSGRAGQRVALNLASVEQDEVPRGTVAVRGDIAVTHMVDVSYTHTSTEIDLDDGMAVRFLTGTTERLGRIWLANDAGGTTSGDHTYAQLRLDGPVPCLPGDRYVLRRTSPATTLGGGEVLDPWAAKLRRKQRERVHGELVRLASGDTQVFLDRAGEEGLSPVEWDVRARGGNATPLGDRVFSSQVVARFEGLLLGALADFHIQAPLTLGANRRELRRGRLAHLSERVFDSLADRMATRGAVSVDGPLLRATAFNVVLSDTQVVLQQVLYDAIHGASLAGMDYAAIGKQFSDPATEALTRLLVADERLTLLAQIGLVATSRLTELDAVLRAHFGEHDDLSPSQFKDLTGLTRKTAIPLLEWMDRTGRTRRRHNARLKGPAL
jgi:selenocysteine-specific elongation factor